MNEAVLTLADENIVWADALHKLGLFPTRNAASRKLGKLHERNELAFFARWKHGKTKPIYGYTNAGFKLDNKAHEFILSEIAFLFAHKADAIRRGKRVNQQVLPDLEMDFEKPDGTLGFDVELDRRTMSQTRIRQRFKKHLGTPRIVLVVTDGRKARMEGLIESAKKEGLEAFFTTLDKLRLDPFGKVWTGTNGEAVGMDI